MKRRKVVFGLCWIFFAIGIFVAVANVSWKWSMSGILISVAMGLIIANKKSPTEWDTLGHYGRLSHLLKEMKEQQPKY